jgi:ATP-binding cassette subfamily B protein
MSWRLALVTALIAPVTVAVLRLIEREGRRLLRLGRMEAEKMAGILQSMILGLDVIKAFTAERREAQRFQRQQDRLLAVQRRESYVASLVEPVLIAAGAATFMFVVFFAGRFIAEGTMTAAEFITFLVYMMFVLPNVRTLGLQLARWRHVKVALEFLDDASRMEPESDPPGCMALDKSARGTLEFRAVHYHHAGRQAGLRGVSFRLEPGEQVGIVGASGAGKSTILHLLLRFYDPSGGSILIGGQDIARCARSSVRDAVSYVPQDVLLFDGTILDNLRLGRPDASEEEIREACRAAQALAFFEELPDGLLTPTGDRGLKLSSGQRQRLAIARALMKQAPLLLLDEATSALDPATEVMFGAALRRLAGDRTMLIVAHRLSTVAGLPRIIFLHEGVVAGDGSHAELAAGSAAYREVTGTIGG